MSQYASVSQSDIPDRIDSSVPLSVASLVGRVLLSAIYLISGLSKLAAPAATIGYITSAGLPFAPLGLAIAVVVEILGGAALIVGYRTRFVAAVLAVFTVATAAFSALGVWPAGFGTARTFGCSATSWAAISSVRSREGPSAMTSSSSPG